MAYVNFRIHNLFINYAALNSLVVYSDLVKIVPEQYVFH